MIYYPSSHLNENVVIKFEVNKTSFYSIYGLYHNFD